MRDPRLRPEAAGIVMDTSLTRPLAFVGLALSEMWRDAPAIA